jgi:cytidylate kinase
MATPSLVIAVDGPAASGKGTVARGLARHFALPFLDTGKLYRAVALSLLRWGGDPDSEFAALRACEDIAGLMDDPELKSEMVGGIASRVSAYPAVRTALLDRQRDFAASPGGAVLDGRDIGTVIAPDAPAKLFVTASLEERARRRHLELTAAGLPVHLDDILIDLRARDERDAGRDAAPLVMAEDALLLDTSAMNPDAALAEAIRLVETRLAT